MFFGMFPVEVDIFTEVPSRLAESIGAKLPISIKIVKASAFRLRYIRNSIAYLVLIALTTIMW